ncbi:MAG: hypothetical protein AB1632_01820 [Nitrospirota bacterium]
MKDSGKTRKRMKKYTGLPLAGRNPEGPHKFTRSSRKTEMPKNDIICFWPGNQMYPDSRIAVDTKGAGER